MPEGKLIPFSLNFFKIYDQGFKNFLFDYKDHQKLPKNTSSNFLGLLSQDLSLLACEFDLRRFDSLNGKLKNHFDLTISGKRR